MANQTAKDSTLENAIRELKNSPAQLVAVFVSYADWIRKNKRALRERVTT